MKISNLIKKLERIRQKHGDLRCVTAGFDEANLVDIGTIDLVKIKVNLSAGSGMGEHVEAKDDKDSELSILIDR
jgi:hypothetical protein